MRVIHIQHLGAGVQNVPYFRFSQGGAAAPTCLHVPADWAVMALIHLNFLKSIIASNRRCDTGMVVAENSSGNWISPISMTQRVMATHPCIFCSKTHQRLFQPEPAGGLFAVSPAPESLRTAVPTFNGRVSPVLDTCRELCVLEASGKLGVAKRTIPMKAGSIYERAGEIKKLGIRVIICGAVSEAFYNLLGKAGIGLVCGITGDIDEVVAAYRNGTLDQPRFRMPGSE
jgi:predicted Fe-Mo cluster-binding NifX family protein